MQSHVDLTDNRARNPTLNGQNNYRTVPRTQEEMFLTKVKLSSSHYLSKVINLATDTLWDYFFPQYFALAHLVLAPGLCERKLWRSDMCQSQKSLCVSPKPLPSPPAAAQGKAAIGALQPLHLLSFNQRLILISGTPGNRQARNQFAFPLGKSGGDGWECRS